MNTILYIYAHSQFNSHFSSTFQQLLRCCEEAPHWEKGFQDTIIDAIRLIEGSEIIPTINIYNAIIKAFARAYDANAAEFYYWEMLRKGIEPTTVTYNNLMFAYSMTLRVGAPETSLMSRPVVSYMYMCVYIRMSIMSIHVVYM